MSLAAFKLYYEYDKSIKDIKKEQKKRVSHDNRR